MALRLMRKASLPVAGQKQAGGSFITTRFKRYEAYDSQFDENLLEEARSWYKAFDASKLPEGSTTYARSSGPGGQHVNKTESKAVTAYPVKEILSMIPSSLHSAVRASKYYTANNDSLTFHAQTQRSRAANADENRSKFVDEVTRMYREKIPAKTSGEKKKKHEEIENRFHESRMKQKRFQGAKKQARKGSFD